MEQDGRWFLIANLYGQDDYGKKGLYTDYAALEQAMTEIRGFLDVREKHETVAFPYKIGCGSAGGDWEIVEEMIRGYSGITTERCRSGSWRNRPAGQPARMPLRSGSTG